MKQTLELFDLITRGSSIEAYLRNILLIDKRILGSGIGMLYLFCMIGANLWTWETKSRKFWARVGCEAGDHNYIQSRLKKIRLFSDGEVPRQITQDTNTYLKTARPKKDVDPKLYTITLHIHSYIAVEMQDLSAELRRRVDLLNSGSESHFAKTKQRKKNKNKKQTNKNIKQQQQKTPRKPRELVKKSRTP